MHLERPLWDCSGPHSWASTAAQPRMEFPATRIEMKSENAVQVERYISTYCMDLHRPCERPTLHHSARSFEVLLPGWNALTSTLRY